MERLHYIRLPLKNAFNVRDLGGYSCKPDGITRWNTILRGDDLALLDESDIKFLIDYGVKSIIDLRSPGELEENPNPFDKVKGIDYFNVPLMSGDMADITRLVRNNPSKFISDFYVSLLRDETQLIKRILNIIAENKDGAVLFHCKVGKDRTGVMAAILLGIAGVDTADIISNYEVTYTYNTNNPFFKEGENNIPLEVMLSKAEYLKNAIEYVNTNYGSLNNYLLSSGIDKKILDRIRERFVCRIGV